MSTSLKVLKQEPPCEKCPAICCNYYALQIDTPEDKDDFEHMKWYLAHAGSSIYVEDGDWFLEVKSRCNFLGQDNRCQAYERRPQMCRDYGTNQKGEVDCHMSEGEVEHEQFFSSMDDLEAYVVETYSF